MAGFGSGYNGDYGRDKKSDQLPLDQILRSIKPSPALTLPTSQSKSLPLFLLSFEGCFSTQQNVEMPMTAPIGIT